MTEDSVLKAWKKARDDFEWCCATFFKVKNKRGKIVPLELNPAQMVVWEEMKRLRAAGKPPWVLIAKARQQGMSTLAAAICAWIIFFRQGQNFLVVNYREDKVRELFAKVEFIYDHLPAEIKPDKAPGSRSREILITKAPLSTMAIAESAENVEIGVSSTFQHGHLTEFPLWRDAEQSMGGFLPTVEPHVDSFLIGESTARAMGDWFHTFWEDSVAGKTRFSPVFVPWFKTPEYARGWEDDDEPLSPKWRRFQREHSLSDEQVLWYREQEGELGGHRLAQEYPTTVEDMFRAAGQTYFDAVSLARLRERVGKPTDENPLGKILPIKTGNLEADGRGKPRFVEWDHALNRAPWRVYKRPEKGRAYVIGADPSGGTSRDYSSADILDAETLEQVASFLGRLDPDDFAVQLNWMGRTYNDALLAVEKNGEGRATVLRLQQLNYPYIFRHAFEDNLSGSVAPTWGWVTSAKTRPTMIAQLETLLRDGLMLVNDERTVKQLESFIRIDTSKLAEAAQGAWDDAVMSLAIAANSEVRNRAVASVESVVVPEYSPGISSVTGY